MNHQTFCNRCKSENLFPNCNSLKSCIIPSFLDGNNNVPIECFLYHVDGLLQSWTELSKKYIPSILRISKKTNSNIDENDIDKYLKLLCIFHDVGKLTETYKNSLSKGDFRHEFVSAYIFYEFTKSFINQKMLNILTASILLHHEPILMGQVHRMYENKLTATELYRRIMALDENIKMLSEWKKAVNYFLENYLAGLKTDNNFFNNSITKYELYRFLQRFISKIRNTGMKKEKVHTRIFVGAFLSILVLSDYKSAENRGEDSKVSFFWYTAKKEFE